jgi:hypothetical protein
MAASPIAALPVIRTLATVNLYRHFRTYQGADSASGALIVLAKGCRRVASGIHFAGLGDRVLGAEMDTNLAALAKLLVDLDIAFCAHLKAFLGYIQF